MIQIRGKTKPPLGPKARGGLKANSLVSYVGQQSDVTSSLDSHGQFSLVTGAGAGHTTGNDLGALREVSSQASYILVINGFNLIGAEGADFSSSSAAISIISLHCGKSSFS